MSENDFREVIEDEKDVAASDNNIHNDKET